MRALAVDRGKIDGLGPTSHCACDIGQGNVEDERRGLTMDITACLERFDEGRITREVCEKAKLDLRIISGQQQPTIAWDEASPNVAAQFTANWNVLQIRIIGRKPAAAGYCLIERGVQTACFRVDEPRKRVKVCVLELG